MPEVDNVPPPGIVSTDTVTSASAAEITFVSAELDVASSPAAAPAEQAECPDATLIGVPTGV